MALYKKDTPMTLNENNYIEKISALSIADWNPIRDLIANIEGVEQFGDCTKATELLKKGIITTPQYEEHWVVSEFREAVYSIPIIIDFNWSAWDEGRKMATDKNFDFNTINIPTKCKLITAIVRNDRFCDGALVTAFNSGLMLKILKSIEKQLT
jgi:hypothetical protein